MEQTNKEKLKSKKNFGKNLSKNKKELQYLIKEKIKHGELKYMSRIEILEGMPSYKSIKKIWTKKELEDIFGIKIRISSYSDSEIIEAYTRVKAMYGNVTSKLMKQETGIGVDSIRIRFGSWNKFLIFLGEKPKRELNKVTDTNEEIINFYRNVSIKVGKIIYGASFTDLKKYGFPYSKSVLGIRFTNMNNLRELAGFQKRSETKTKYTKQHLGNILFEYYKIYGRRLTQTEIMKDENLPNPTAFFNYFQTTEIRKIWDEVLELHKFK